MAAHLILSLILTFVALIGPALAQEPEVGLKKVAVLPFPVLAKTAMEALGNKVRQEFQERLKAEGFTLAPEEDLNREAAKLKEAVTATQAREIGHKLGADVVIWGRVVVVAELLSLEARLLDLTGKVPLVTLKAEGAGMPPFRA